MTVLDADTKLLTGMLLPSSRNKLRNPTKFAAVYVPRATWRATKASVPLGTLLAIKAERTLLAKALKAESLGAKTVYGPAPLRRVAKVVEARMPSKISAAVRLAKTSTTETPVKGVVDKDAVVVVVVSASDDVAISGAVVGSSAVVDCA